MPTRGHNGPDAQLPAPRRRRLLGRRATPGAGEALDALATGVEIATALRDGLTAPAASGAARRLRALLDADAVGLVDLDGARTWAGREVTDDTLVDEVLRTDRRAARGDVAALPLRVRDEPAGVLVVAGPVPDGAARKAAAKSGQSQRPRQTRAQLATAARRDHDRRDSREPARPRTAQGPAGYTVTVTGTTFQMSSQYSAMARSDENFPLRAVLRIDIRDHAAGFCHAALTRSWHSMQDA